VSLSVPSHTSADLAGERAFAGLKEPRRKRAIAFIDGRNLRHAARHAFGDSRYEDTHPLELARRVCEREGWRLDGVRYYIGVPREGRVIAGESREDWEQRAEMWKRQRVSLIARELNGSNREKGIDVRLSLDAVRLMECGAYDVALIFSQDQDFREAVQEIREAAAGSGRWVQVVSAFPESAERKGHRGIDNADRQIAIPREVFDACLAAAETRIRPLRHPAGMRAAAGIAAAITMSFYLASYGAAAAYFTWADMRATQNPTPAQVTQTVLGNAAKAFFWPYYLAEEFGEEWPF
jgi:uncharacterized LabA/DUF88 family protein